MKRASESPSAPAKPVLKLASVTALPSATLIPNPVYQDCVDNLREMLEQAEKGELIGYAVAVMYKGRDYCVNSFGEVGCSPTFARGMVAALDDHLQELVHQ